ncbi:hypothetical protein M0R45_035746 [Rubus argutus]|uniref:Secreted protein n=1 Tax=Rubus argutus TaxID=59490 RepID=A0AAW1VU18_RUBAR
MLIIISFCVLLTIFFKVVGSTQCRCRSEFKCWDDGPLIHFPFRLKDRHPDHCGLSGWGQCNNDISGYSWFGFFGSLTPGHV